MNILFDYTAYITLLVILAGATICLFAYERKEMNGRTLLKFGCSLMLTAAILTVLLGITGSQLGFWKSLFTEYPNAWKDDFQLAVYQYEFIVLITITFFIFFFQSAASSLISKALELGKVYKH